MVSREDKIVEKKLGLQGTVNCIVLFEYADINLHNRLDMLMNC